jgi:glycogen operon protein
LQFFSDHATKVELCLFSQDGKQETERVMLNECTNGVWHGFLEGIKEGQRYGYRVDGPWEPMIGQRFNANKLLLDPYAKKLSGAVKWDDALYGYTVSANKDADLTKDERDSARFMPKGVVVGSTILTKSAPPLVPWPKTVIYESHVKGLTVRHPLIPTDIRGTYRAISDPAMIDHYLKIGVTSIELLPIHAFLQDRHLQEKNLTNYWGYNTLNFFAPEPRYFHDDDLSELAQAIDRLHSAGLEVILDVVYNHTCEGNHLGPTFSWKGIDNLSYYRTLPGEPRFYDNLTGCGNAVNTSHPKVLQMVMDSLRMWATVYGVDGFRFDLALTLGRNADGFSRDHAIFHAMLQDPILCKTKLIAEPWDVGPGGYQLGSFPPGFSEWNGAYRDVIRQFWKGDEGLIAKFAQKFAASSDLFNEGHRRPWSSVNFITAHDGFTLHDLVSYNDKHNEANGENNNDGANDNQSWNCGAEGDTDSIEIIKMRDQQKRNLLATLFLSQGVPMMLAGDEMHHTQQGNNNTYCQDNELSWLNWEKLDEGFIAFVSKLTHIRKQYNAISRKEFVTGRLDDKGNTDIAWFNVNGELMKEENWLDDFNKAIVVKYLSPKKDEPAILVIVNASHLSFDALTPCNNELTWKELLNTTLEDKSNYDGNKLTLAGRSVYVFEGKKN